MPERTEQNLAYAFAAESKAAARNTAFAQKADHDGNPQTARLFRALAESESVQARRYLLLMRGKIGSTQENLDAAFQDTMKAYEETYPRIIQEAGGEGQATAKTAFDQTRQVEPYHTALLKKGMDNTLSGVDLDFYICQICGYVSEGRAPEKCPICGAIPGKFKLVV